MWFLGFSVRDIAKRLVTRRYLYFDQHVSSFVIFVVIGRFNHFVQHDFDSSPSFFPNFVLIFCLFYSWGWFISKNPEQRPGFSLVLLTCPAVEFTISRNNRKGKIALLITCSWLSHHLHKFLGDMTWQAHTIRKKLSMSLRHELCSKLGSYFRTGLQSFLTYFGL